MSHERKFTQEKIDAHIIKRNEAMRPPSRQSNYRWENLGRTKE